MGSHSAGFTPISSSSSSSSCSFVSPEEFKAFHNIDRTLYTRLVFILNRDPAESVQVVALWIWLEQAKQCSHLVHKMLSLPDTIINALADEAALCLGCVGSDQFQYSSSDSSNNIDLPLTHSLSKTGISLVDFHENRLCVLRGITRIVDEVCARAFEDILLQVLLDERRLPASFMNGPVIDPLLHVMDSNNNNNNNNGMVVGGDQNYVGSLQQNGLHVGGWQNDTGLTQMISTGDNYVKDAQDDRTIFLTFSKGYPISEDEVRAFFTRKYGDCIEAIYMQEVLGEEQQLYARLVVHSPVTIQTFLNGRSKAKFSINGKHVWARKYVPKNTKPLSPVKFASSPLERPSSPPSVSLNKVSSVWSG